MRGWKDNSNVARAAICSIIVQAQRRDDTWFAIASDTLGSPEASLRDYDAHGDNLSLVILIHVVRQQFNLFNEQYWPWYEFSKVLEAASKFDVLDTSPELQHEFCALWNQVTRGAVGQSSPSIFSDRFATFISRSIYTPIPPQQHSMLPLVTTITSCRTHLHTPVQRPWPSS
jgi:hypothetical protein